MNNKTYKCDKDAIGSTDIPVRSIGLLEQNYASMNNYTVLKQYPIVTPFTHGVLAEFE